MSKNDNYIYPTLVMSNDINTGEGVKTFPPWGKLERGKNQQGELK
jgi:hypothetical protein